MNISVEEWNEKYPPGTRVRIEERKIVIPAREHVTKCEAFMCGDVPIVRVDDGKEFVQLKTIDSVVSENASNA